MEDSLAGVPHPGTRNSVTVQAKLMTEPQGSQVPVPRFLVRGGATMTVRVFF
jgi:hypothetical protein